MLAYVLASQPHISELGRVTSVHDAGCCTQRPSAANALHAPSGSSHVRPRSQSKPGEHDSLGWRNVVQRPSPFAQAVCTTTLSPSLACGSRIRKRPSLEASNVERWKPDDALTGSRSSVVLSLRTRWSSNTSG